MSHRILLVGDGVRAQSEMYVPNKLNLIRP